MPPLAITGLGCLTALGHDTQAHLAAIATGPTDFRTLADLGGLPDEFSSVPAAWIEPRSLLSHRKWSPASCAALKVARDAVADAGWSADEVKDAVVIYGTSRGSGAGWHQPWPGRRPFKLMAASNTLPSEPAAAICHELGIQATWNVVSTGCTSGLDALGTAALWLNAGQAERALVVACDLPLTPPVLEAYQATGILAHADRPGMRPSEGAAALCLEKTKPEKLQLTHYDSIGEPTAALGVKARLPGLRTLLSRHHESFGTPDYCIPHASGTQAHAPTETTVIDDVFGANLDRLALKPYTGHCVGASALIETVISCAALHTDSSYLTDTSSSVLKIASAMGGKHSLALIEKTS